MLVPMPASLDPVTVASMSDNIPDAWRTVGPYLAQSPGAPVLVIGGAGPSISFYSIAIALALGASAVTYADQDEARLAKAEHLGASVAASLEAIPSRNYPVTICSVASQPALTAALKATEPDGTCVCNAIFFEGQVALPMLDMYVRGVRLVTGRVNARAVIPSALDLVTGKRFDPAPVTDMVVEWDDAAAALTSRQQKLVIHR
jgi:alcohol dehydrogenase